MNFVIIHGAWHCGELFEATAKPLRDAGHDVWLPTLKGNTPGADKNVGLAEVIDEAVADIVERNMNDVVLVGHSYAGMVITGMADRIPERLRRLVYWNAFVPNNGESLNDMVPPHYVGLFDDLVEDSGAVSLPFPIWRDGFINDADLALAESAYALLNPHPYRTFSEGIKISKNPAEMVTQKSYINCTEDTALPHSHGWHPRLSEKLGLFRLIQTPGSHELCFSDPGRLAECILQAGRD